jgi:acetyl esterase/lipase
VYADGSGVALRADVYAPPSDGPFPGVLVVHGGSWQRGNKERMRRVAERLARHGYVAVSIDYRLAPANRYPTQLHDCQDAVRWMRRNAAWLHIDPMRIGGFGYSAGAHLVALLATTDPAASLDVASRGTPADTRLQAAVIGAAPTDLRRFRPNWVFNRLLGGPPDQMPDLYAAASPITFVTPDDPPMFLYHGAHDWMVDPSQSQIMVDALRRAHVPVEYYETRGGHFSTFLFDADEVRHALAFLDRWLKEPPNATL